MKKWIIIVLTGGGLVFFQNCQKSSFESDSQASSSKTVSGDLVPVEQNDSDDSSGAITQPADDNDDDGPGQSGGAGHSNGGGATGNYDHQEAEADEDRSCDKDKDQEKNVCILDGPGKSVKLGLNDETLGGQNPVPKVVCVTKKACLEIASQHFTVKSSEFRGYCKEGHNPHVIPLTDEQVQAKINDLKKKAAQQNP